jgi:DDE_Tnp_1-associated/Transposase DDE domain
MQPARAGSLLAYLAQVPDPRGRKGRRHDLSALLTAVVCGILCGARGYSQLAEWLHEQTVDVWHWMGFRRRPPKLDCFRDLLIKLDPAALQQALQAWITTELGLSSADECFSAISIDGKTLCATLRAFSKAVHLLAAVDHRTGCVLSQSRVDEKTNEHKGALELLKTLVLEGRVVVGDAAFCQRDLCEQILEAQGDYFLAVKENQPGLLREIEHEFAAQDAAFSPLSTAAAAI